MNRTVLRYHLYHPIVRGSCFVTCQDQRAGFAMNLNRHLVALVTGAQYDLVD